MAEEKPSESSGNILIVEDDRDTADAIVVLLTTEGYGVRTVSSRDEAVEALKLYIYHCILMDLRMPGMSLENFVAAKRTLSLRGKVILMTAEPKAEEKYRPLNLDAFIRKPFNIDEVLKILKLHCC